MCQRVCVLFTTRVRTYFRSRPPHPGRTRPLPDQLDHGVEGRAQLEAAELDQLLHGGMERHVGEDCVGSAVCQ